MQFPFIVRENVQGKLFFLFLKQTNKVDLAAKREAAVAIHRMA